MIDGDGRYYFFFYYFQKLDNGQLDMVPFLGISLRLANTGWKYRKYLVPVHNNPALQNLSL